MSARPIKGDEVDSYRKFGGCYHRGMCNLLDILQKIKLKL